MQYSWTQRDDVNNENCTSILVFIQKKWGSSQFKWGNIENLSQKDPCEIWNASNSWSHWASYQPVVKAKLLHTFPSKWQAANNSYHCLLPTRAIFPLDSALLTSSISYFRKLLWHDTQIITTERIEGVVFLILSTVVIQEALLLCSHDGETSSPIVQY